MGEPWVGFDLDGVLAYYDGFKGPDVIGEPIQSVVELAKSYIDSNYEIRIFTARVHHDGTVDSIREAVIARLAIDNWCLKVFGTVLPVTCSKDYDMVALYDDRAYHINTNQGITVDPNVRSKLLHQLEIIQTSNNTHEVREAAREVKNLSRNLVPAVGVA